MNGGSTDSSVRQALERLAGILTEENSLLESGQSTDHAHFVSGKNHVLRELILFQRNEASLGNNPALQEQLKSVRKLVDRNYQLLTTHVEAMNEVATMLAEAEIEQDADGTYDQHQRY